MTEETKSITIDCVVDETTVNLAKKKKRRLWTLLGVSTFLLAGGVAAYIMY
jgi:flagellar basal body-associated protein FliL